MSRLLFLAILAAMLVAGIGLRWHDGRTPFVSSNVDTFYFHRTEILVGTGEFPKEDKWGFAPEIWPENTPPLLGYLTWGGFAPWKALGAGDDLAGFADFFPVAVYALWFAATAAATWSLYRRREPVIVTTALVTFTPMAIQVTGYGRYFEENVGVPFLFLAAMLFMRLRRPDRTLWWGIAALTGFVLSWQAFPFFYAAAVGVMLIGWILGDRDRTALVSRVLMLAVPILLAEAVVGLFVGNAYSALGMIREFWLAFANRNDPAMLNAMYRRDWRNVPWEDLGKYYGPAGVFLLLVGMAASLLRPRDNASHAALGFGAVGVALVAAFSKFRHLALGFFGAPWLLGMQALTDPNYYFDAAAACGGRMRRWLLNSWRKVAFASAAAFLAAILTVGFWTFWAWRLPHPVGEISVITANATGDLRTVEIKMTNTGGRTSAMKKAFAGFHIAVENGDILRSMPFSDGIGEPSLGTKSFSHWGKANFFEVSYPRLLEGDSAGIVLDIRKTSEKPITVYWRAWLPKYYCSFRDRREGITDLRAGWRNLAQGWRNENCIVRIPANNDRAVGLCPTKVFAAHHELQDFRCAREKIP